MRFLAVALLAACADAVIKVGDTLPAVTLDYGFPPEKVNLLERSKGKKIILMGLPGAFTPTWSTRQVPGYLENADALKKVGVDEVIVYCVNDGAVMDAWAQDQGVDKEPLITMMGDPTSTLTGALGMELTHAGPQGKGLVGRCKRFALYAEDGVVKALQVSEGPGPKGEEDPAGDDFPEASCAPNMLKEIKKLNPLFKDEV